MQLSGRGRPGFAKSTLPNRYERMKNKFVNVLEEDNVKIIQAKLAIDAEFEAKERWQRVIARVHELGGQEYTVHHTSVLNTRTY